MLSTEGTRDAIRKLVREKFDKNNPVVKFEVMRWARDEGKLKFHMPFDVSMYDARRGERYQFGGTITISSRENVPAFTEGLKLTWEVSSIVLERAAKQVGEKKVAPLE